MRPEGVVRRRRRTGSLEVDIDLLLVVACWISSNKITTNKRQTKYKEEQRELKHRRRGIPLYKPLYMLLLVVYLSLFAPAK